MTDPKALPVRVKVRDLVWEDFDGMGAKAKAMMIVSYLITKWADGEFRIEISAPGYGSRFDGPHIHPTLEAAKAAAQADYEARILSAIKVVEDDVRAAAMGIRALDEDNNEVIIRRPAYLRLRAALTKGSTDDRT